MAIKELVISDADRKLLELIQNGDRLAIIKGLSHKGAIYRVNGIINAVKYSAKEPEIQASINQLKEDDIVMNGYKVSEFAIAALDVMDIERYRGNETRIHRLINSKFDF